MQHEINNRATKLNGEYFYSLDNFIDAEKFNKIYTSIVNGLELSKEYYVEVIPNDPKQMYDDNYVKIFKLTLKAKGEDLEPIKNFKELTNWINESNIFKKTNRIIFYINPKGSSTSTHYDYQEGNKFIHRDQFLWIDFLNQKEFFILDDKFNKRYSNGKFLVFRTMNWHGCEPTKEDCFSIRIDGRYTDDFLEISNLKKHDYDFKEED